MNLKARIEVANKQAHEIIVSSQPRWVDVRPAIEVVPGMKKNTILHAGPPTSWDRMCSAQKKSVRGAAVFEGLAKDMDEAEAMAQGGELTIEPCHEHAAEVSGNNRTDVRVSEIAKRDRQRGCQRQGNSQK